MFNFRNLLFFLTLFSGMASANNYYYWYISGTDSYRFESAVAACEAKAARMGSGWEYLGVTPSTTTKMFCRILHESGDGSNYFTTRSGSSCPPNTEYDFQTGACLPPPPEPDPEQCVIGEEITRPTYSTINGSPSPSPQICSNSCLYDFERRSGIGLEEPDFPNVVKYTAYYVGNGQSCTNPTPPETPPDPTEPPPPDPTDPTDPTDPPDGGDTGGGGSDGGGNTGGGNTGGGNTGGGSDGGGSEGGGSNGGGSDGGGSNGGGNTGGGSEGGGNTGGSGTGGDGDGDGNGSGSAESVDNCESGRCDFGDDRGDPFGGEVRSFADSLTAAMSGMKNSPLGSSIGNIQFPTGGTCPTGSTSINIGIGSIPIDFTEHCNFWQQIAPILSAVFLALWAIIAVRVFLSA